MIRVAVMVTFACSVGWRGVGLLDRRSGMRHLLRRGLTVLLLGALLLAAYPATQALALSSGLWSKARDMQVSRANFTLIALPDGTAFAFGGLSSGGLTPTGEIYDPQTDNWRFVLNAPSATWAYRDTAW
jgi:hypothetical protein